MATIEISNAETVGIDGVMFTGTRGGTACTFLVVREALEDVEYQELASAQELLDAFGRQQALIASCAAKALDAGTTGKDGAAHIELQTLLA